MDIDIVKRFIYGAKEAYKKVDNHSYNFPITIESAYRLATNIETLLKEQEAVERTCRKRINGFSIIWTCGACGSDLYPNNAKAKYCSNCGQAVKWE